jgi:hypothetical protein
MSPDEAWMQTLSGGWIYPLNPSSEDINIGDIAGALSKLCRFGGHCLLFESVAEHSILVARSVSPENRLTALLHDASEAYLNDMPKPIKNHLDEYLRFEIRLMEVISAKFGTQWPLPEEVKKADRAILTDERQQNMALCSRNWTEGKPTLGILLKFWTPREAELEFMRAFFEYGGKL